MVRPGLYIAVGLGSAVGALLRLACSLWLANPEGSLPLETLPLPTLLVNVIGSFWIGCYATLTATDGRWRVSVWHKQFMLSGVCAGFTTFSVFSMEFMQLLLAGQVLLAIGYLLLSAGLWLLACWAGLRLAAGLNNSRQ